MPVGGRSDDASDWLPDLFRAAAEGDRDAHTIVEEVSTLVGIAAANVSCVMDPSLVVLGGALGMQGEPLLRRVRQIVGRIMPAPPAVVASDLDKDAPLWGSLLVAIARGAGAGSPRSSVAGRIMSPPKPRKERQRHETALAPVGPSQPQRW